MFEIETPPHVDAYDEKDLRHEFSGDNIQQAFSRMLGGICSQGYDNPQIVSNLNIRATSGEPFFHCLIITELKAEQVSAGQVQEEMMERLEVIVWADELKPGDMVRRDLNTQHPEERKQTVVHIKLTEQNGVNVVFESPEKIRWATHYRRSQRLILVHQPRPEGKTMEDVLNEVFALASSLPGRIWLMNQESMTRLEVRLIELRKALEALELSKPLEPKE